MGFGQSKTETEVLLTGEIFLMASRIKFITVQEICSAATCSAYTKNSEKQRCQRNMNFEKVSPSWCDCIPKVSVM